MRGFCFLVVLLSLFAVFKHGSNYRDCNRLDRWRSFVDPSVGWTRSCMAKEDGPVHKSVYKSKRTLSSLKVKHKLNF